MVEVELPLFEIDRYIVMEQCPNTLFKVTSCYVEVQKAGFYILQTIDYDPAIFTWDMKKCEEECRYATPVELTLFGVRDE